MGDLMVPLTSLTGRPVIPPNLLHHTVMELPNYKTCSEMGSSHESVSGKDALPVKAGANVTVSVIMSVELIKQDGAWLQTGNMY